MMLFLQYKVNVHGPVKMKTKVSHCFTIMVFVLLVKYSECQDSTLQHSRFASDHKVFRNNSSKEKVCPHWTYHTPRNSSCRCGDSIFGVIKCTDDKSPVYVLSCHCMTLSDWGTVVEGICPYLCTNNFQTVIHDNRDLHNGHICNKIMPQNRSGQLCGRCKKGYAPAAYSYSFICANCTNYKYNWIKYIAIAYVPITILFAIVLLFRLSAMSPALNANIFFCQIVSSPAVMSLLSVFMYFSEQTPVDPELDMKKAIRALSILYGVWNLDFFHLVFEPVCLHPGMTTLGVIALDYCVAIYPIILIALTYFLVKIYDRFIPIQKLWKPVTHLLHYCNKEWSRKVSNFLIETFGTFFLLSYVKVINTSFALLMPVWVRNVTGQTIGTYLYYNGSMEYLGPEHRPFFSLAISMFITFNIIPFLLFCFYPCQCFQSCLNRCRLNSQVLRTFMDAFQGCYKIEPYDCRYFSTFFLVLRITGLLSFYFTKSWYFFLINGATAIPVTAFLAIVRPYKKDIFNIIDLVFLLVFILFCLGAISMALCSFRLSYELFAYSVLILSLAFAPVYAFIITMYMIVPKLVITYLRKKCLPCQFNSTVGGSSLHNIVSN